MNSFPTGHCRFTPLSDSFIHSNNLQIIFSPVKYLHNERRNSATSGFWVPAHYPQYVLLQHGRTAGSEIHILNKMFGVTYQSYIGKKRCNVPHTLLTQFINGKRRTAFFED